MPKAKRNPVSLAEWFIVFGLFLTVAGIAGGVALTQHQQKDIRTAWEQIELIRKACITFKQENGHWPVHLPGIQFDFHYGKATDLANGEVINALLNRPGNGNPEGQVNTTGKIYLPLDLLDRENAGINQEGDFVDPWGNPYQIVFDMDENQICDLDYTIYGNIPNKYMVIWSHGLDEQPNTEDDLCSWKVE